MYVLGRYEDFLRCSVDWLWETDATLALSFVTSPVALTLGIPAQALIGRPLLSLGRFELAAGPTEPDPWKMRQPFRNAVFVMNGAEQHEVPYLLSGVPYYDELDGSFAGFRGTAIAAPPPAAVKAKPETKAEPPSPPNDDLADLNRALEDTLLRNADLSWRLSRLNGTRKEATETPPPPTASFDTPTPLARTAHELRTPLNAVIGYADLGLSGVFGPLGERYQDCFRTIRGAGQHMDGLIAGLQAAAKSNGPNALAHETVEIADVVVKAKAIIALAAREAEVDISRIGPMAGGLVSGDHGACVQILLNLLSNAVKFTPAGGSIGLETVVGPDNMLQIVVWDSGIGIALDEQQKIFEPDYRVPQAQDEQKIPGSGLGLSISRDLARAMGGDLTAISRPGQGSRFILSLPLAVPPSSHG